jgi:hypothetical protein
MAKEEGMSDLLFFDVPTNEGSETFWKSSILSVEVVDDNGALGYRWGITLKTQGSEGQKIYFKVHPDAFIGVLE